MLIYHITNIIVNTLFSLLKKGAKGRHFLDEKVPAFNGSFYIALWVKNLRIFWPKDNFLGVKILITTAEMLS